MTKFRQSVDEHGNTEYTPAPDGKLLVDMVIFDSAVDGHLGLEGGSEKRVALLFRSKADEGQEYQLILDQADARRFVETISEILAQQEDSDRQGNPASQDSGAGSA